MAEQRLPTSGMPPADQSMEDILASIRRILNEDEVAQPAPTATEPLALTEEMLVKEPGNPPVAVSTEAPATEPAPASSPGFAAESLPAAPAGITASESDAAEPTTPPLLPAETLIAPAVAAAASAAIGNLLRAVSQDRNASVTRSGPSIEDVVREELRPLLKDWLDQHLPGLVERLVRAEIERLVGRALG